MNREVIRKGRTTYYPSTWPRHGKGDTVTRFHRMGNCPNPRCRRKRA